MPHARFDIAGQWAKTNDTIIDLVDVIPEVKLDWSPQEDLWTLRHILAHVSNTRYSWLDPRPERRESRQNEVWDAAQTTEGVKDILRQSWSKVERFVSDQGLLDRVFEGTLDGVEYSYSGHWIAYHLLEHDIHHRADVFHYLALLGVAHPEVETP